MNTLYYFLRELDLIAAEGTLHEDSSDLMKILASLDQKSWDTIVLKLNYDTIRTADALNKSMRAKSGYPTNEGIGPDESFSNVMRTKKALEEFFGKRTVAKIEVLGPNVKEEDVIRKHLSSAVSLKKISNHFFIFGIINDVKNIEMCNLRGISELPEHLGSELLSLFVIFDKEKYKKENFVSFPADSYLGLNEATVMQDRLKTDLTRALNEVLSFKSKMKDYDDLFTQDITLKKVISRATLMSNINLLITIAGKNQGERKFFAKMVHSHSQRKDKEFIYVDCGKDFSGPSGGDVIGLLPLFAPPDNLEGSFPKFLMKRDLQPRLKTPAKIKGKPSNMKRNYEESDEEGNYVKYNEIGTVFLDNIDLLSEDGIYLLERIIQKEKLEDLEEGRKKPQLICGVSERHKLELLSRELIEAISFNVIQIPTLEQRGYNEKRRIITNTIFEINSILRNTVNRHKETELSFEIPHNAMLVLLLNNFPNSELELKSFIKKAFANSVISILTGEKELNKSGEIVLQENEALQLIEEQKVLGTPTNILNHNEIGDIGIPKNKYTHLYKVDLNSVSDLEDFLKVIEKDYLLAAKAVFGRGQEKIGQALGYTQSRVYRRMKALGIDY